MISQVVLYTLSVIGKTVPSVFVVAIIVNVLLSLVSIMTSGLMIVKVFDVKFPLYAADCLIPNSYISPEVVYGYWNGTLIGNSNQLRTGIIIGDIIYVLTAFSSTAVLSCAYLLYTNKRKVESAIVNAS